MSLPTERWLAFKIGEEQIYVELTTPGQLAAHLLRGAYDPRYPVAEFVTYVLIL